jgi:hypothetical protein
MRAWEQKGNRVGYATEDEGNEENIKQFGDWLLCSTKKRKCKIRQTGASLIKVEDLEWELNYQVYNLQRGLNY